MFCTKCGAQLPDTAKFCDKCGSPVAAASAQSVPQSSSLQPAQSAGVVPPESPMRALWLTAILTASTVIFMILSMPYFLRLSDDAQYTGTALPTSITLVSYALIACIFYFFTKRKYSLAATGLGGLILAIYLYALSNTAQIYMNMQWGRVFQTIRQYPPAPSFILYCFITLVAGGITLFLLKNQTDKKRLMLAGIIAGVAGILFEALYLSVFVNPGFRMYLNAHGNSIIDRIGTGVFLALSVLAIHTLCNMKSRKLETGTGAKIWFLFVIAFNIVAQIIINNVNGTFDSLSFLLLIPAVTGLIMMWAGRRAGWFVYLAGVGFSVALNWCLATDIGQQFTSLAYLANPLITYAVILRGWREI